MTRYQLYEKYDGKNVLILSTSSYEDIIEQIELNKAGLQNKIGGSPLYLDRLSITMTVDLPVPNKRYY